MSFEVQPTELHDLDPSPNLLQSGFWGAFRQELGWRAFPFRCAGEGLAFDLLALVRRLPLGVRLAYVPHGPALSGPVSQRENLLIDLAMALRPHLGPCLFLRFDLPWGFEGLENRPPPLSGSRRLRKASLDVQPASTVVLDLSQSEEALLAGMKSKTRYNIRLSAKKGIDIRILAAHAGQTARVAAALEEWYELYRETARRDRITLHSRSYYKTLFSLSRGYGEGAPELYLLSARHQGELLAGIIVAVKGEGAWYLYGASSDRKRNLMPAYGLQWRALQLARERGARFYDLFGIPPSDDPDHPMHGLFRFKTGFGGSVIHRPGCYDVPLRPLAYRLYRTAETLRRSWYLRWRKRLVAR